MLAREWLRRGAVATAVVLPLIAGMPPAAAETWEIDKSATQITFTWDHLGLARHGGRAVDVRGEADFAPTDPEKGTVNVVIRASSLWTGTKELDDLLKGADFLDTLRFPEISFRSTGMSRTGARTTDLLGDLTIRDVTLPVVLKTTWNFTGEHPLAAINPRYLGKWTSGFSAEVTIKRSDFGIKRALPLVGDDIRITIEAELLRKE